MDLKKDLASKRYAVRQKNTQEAFVKLSNAELQRLFPPMPDSSTLTIKCRREDYSASLIARAVDDCDAHLLNLNVTSDVTPDSSLVVEIRVNHRNPSGVARSLERYGFSTVEIRDPNGRVDDSLQGRIGELLAHLDV